MSVRNTTRWIAVSGALLLAVLLSGVLLAGTANAQGYRFGSGKGMYGMMGQGMMGGCAGGGIDATTPYSYPSSSGWAMPGMTVPGMMGGMMGYGIDAATPYSYPAASGWAMHGMMGSGMMGGMMGGGIDAATPYSYPAASDWAMHGMMGSGMMGGVMGGGMMGQGMMDGCAAYANAGAPIAIDQAAEAVEQYLAAYGNPDLVLAEVMEFSNHFYAEVEEESTDIHAFELIIDRYTGAVYPEHGPNMMWNAKYGRMGAMMGGLPAGEMTVTPEQARTLAQEYLDAYLPGAEADEAADRFYGYYTIHTLRDGQVAGMLSVNGYSGQVWLHNWHGDFVGMQSPEE